MKAFVNLTKIEDVKKFYSNVEKMDFDVDLASGRYIIDAKSIMGIFSLDLSKKIQLIAHTDDEEVFNELLDKLGNLVVEE